MVGGDLSFRVTGTIASVAAYSQAQTNGTALKLENRYDGGETNLYSEAGILFAHNTGGTLADLRFHLQSVQQPGSVEVSLYRTSTLLGFEQYITARTIDVTAAGWQQLDLHDLHIPLTTGTNYGVVIRALPGFSGFISTAPNTIATANTYAYSNGYPSGNGSFIYTNADLALVANVFFSLPVQMGPLTARETGGQVWVEWKTLSEQNSRSFAIEHSRDGKSWQEIGRVAAKGQSAGPSAYQFRHSDPAAGKQYYRLAQEDLDGTVTRSEIVALVVGKQVQPLLQLLNNPATVGIIRIQLNAKEPVAAALYNGQGKLLQRRQLQPGFNEWTIPGTGRGVYLLRTPTQTLRVMR